MVALASGIAGASPDVAREHVLPERNDDRATRKQTWSPNGAWRQSPPTLAEASGTRVAAMLSVHDARQISVQARGVMVDASGACAPGRTSGPWTAMEETFTGAQLRVAVLDLERAYGCAQIRIQNADASVVGDLQWELTEPRYPDAGRASRDLAARTPTLHAVAPELETIGVVTREAWGARATQCSSPEDDWYRMAIHHTAGPQTAGGTVEEQLRGTQAYGMDSGGYCDIPYQMLVGFDGTLYEGRALELQSGATGGGNNPGNLAVCFIGCYHEPEAECVGGVGHQPTDAMMARGQLLVQTLVRMFDISTADDNIQGHRDWPGNSTACPGARLHPRLGEFRADLTWFSATEAERSWDVEVEVGVGDSAELWIELENTGGLPWLPGETFLAPTEPRDSESPLYDPSWPSESRAATLDAEVLPGEIGRFTLSVSVASEGTFTQPFGLVHEGITWFADAPWGGGPTDDAVTLTVRGVLGTDSTSTGDGAGSSSGNTDPTEAGGTGGDTTGAGSPEDSSSGSDSTWALPQATGEDDGCGCNTSSGSGAWWALGLFGLLGRRRRGF